MNRSLWLFLCVMGWTVLVTTAPAVDVQIVKAGSGKVSIDLSAMACSGGSNAQVFKQTLENDLKLSGWFTVVGRGAGAVVVQGACEDRGGTVDVTCSVANAASQRFYFSGKRYSESSARRLAHKISDEIVAAVKQKKGIASTRIAMVSGQGGAKHVYLCDADGGDLIRLTSEGTICMSPKWWPDAGSLVYTSFHGGFPDVYRILLGAKRRERIVNFPGLNAGAEVSPDGRKIVLTLSKDGNPDLYIKNLDSGQLMRLTRTRHATEASPAWSPDGQNIVFVSDKSGSPQLYITRPGENTEKRVTFKGTENVSPDWGSDGRIVYSSRREGRYQICILDPRSGEQTQVTSDYVDHEDPAWAPDNRHIVFARTEKFQSVLYILDTLGDPPVRLTSSEGDWSFPAWSPR